MKEREAGAEEEHSQQGVYHTIYQLGIRNLLDERQWQRRIPSGRAGVGIAVAEHVAFLWPGNERIPTRHCGKNHPRRRKILMKRTPFLLQPALYIGLLCGIIITVLAGYLALKILTPQGTTFTPGTGAPTAGNVTITIDQDALDLGIRQAVKQVQPQLPFTITNVSTNLRPGDEIDVSVVGAPIVGVSPNLLVTLSPTVAPDGTLDFHVQQVMLVGLNLSLGAQVNQAIEQAINQQFAGYSRGNLEDGLQYQLVNVSTTSSALIITARLTSSS
jgi:hypothetical protein